VAEPVVGPVAAPVAAAEDFLEAYRGELTAELGLEWSETWQGSLECGSNYYSGESLRWDYSSAEWQGSVQLDDPTARARVAEIFARVSAQFGATELDDQAVWSFISSGDQLREQLRIAGRASDTFVVGVSLWSYDLLAEVDRADFIDGLKPDEGLERPEPD
jgi:hypothetical protein